MDGGFDLAREVCGIDDAARAWTFIEGFAAHWLNPLKHSDGYPEAALRAAEDRLGRPLPGAVREGYRLCGRRDDLTGVQDRLLPLDQVHLDERGGVVIFRAENQNVVEWGALLTGDPNPPVVWREVHGGKAHADGGWRPFLPRVSTAWVEMVLSESLFSCEELGDSQEPDHGVIAELERGCDRLPIPDLPLWALPDGPPVRWFHGRDVLLREDAGVWLWARGRTDAGLADVRASLGGKWLMADPD